MYRLEIYSEGDLVCLIHGNIDDITFIIENLKFKVCYRFKISEV